MQSIRKLINSALYPLTSTRSTTTTDNTTDLELQSLIKPTTNNNNQSKSKNKLKNTIKTPQNMKFSHSLIFNSVPEWTSYYLNYEQLKSAIYRFEKNNLLVTGPPTTYSDNIDTTPSNLELAHLIASSSQISTPTTNEKVFTRLLDLELHKITEFYVDKERELLGDLVLLKADIERIEETDARHSGGGGGISGASDTDDDLASDDGSEDGVAARTSKLIKGAFTNVFSDPNNYDAATRAGRKINTRSKSRGISASRNTGSGSENTIPSSPNKPRKTRERTLSVLSTQSENLLGVEEGEENLNSPSTSGSAAIPALRRVQTTSKHNLQASQSSNRRSRAGMSSSSNHGGEEEEIEGVWGSNSDWAIDTRIMYKRRITAVFTALSELKQYVDLNYTGLSKVLKKYDKITNSHLRAVYMSEIVDKTFPFESVTQERISSAIASLIPLYADIATQGDEDYALKQLKAHLREHVVWERNTVWREMIGLERKGWGGTATGGGKRSGIDVPILVGQKGETKLELVTPVGRFFLPSWLNSQVLAGIFAVLLFVTLLNADWFDRVEEQNCLALLAFVTIFWALEIVPLFVTALMVPFLVVVLRVIRSTDGEDRRLTANEATKYIFGQMFSPTIMLLLGGFTLAAALSKQNIDKVLATKVLSFAGTKPRSVLLAYMCVACFASMWISNVAAPVLCYSLIQPILRTLPGKSPFSKALILGIALASNIGGMASPISSPQNLIAIDYMDPPISWLGWFAVSIPVAFTSIFFIWLILLYAYRTDKGVIINPVRVSRETWTGTQWFVVVVTLVTIMLWCVESRLAWLLGDMGIIAIIPIVAFYGSGVLRKADFDHSPWSIVFLAMGGIGLGKAVLSSGLLDDLDRFVQRVVLGMDLWPILALFSVIVLVIATVISHTIASVLVVPIAAQIGSAMEVPHPRLLILATALICSAGMGLPVSGFPNLQAINQEDELGQRYLEPSDFFRVGIPSSIIAVVVIITIGYTIMRAMDL